MDNKFIDYPLIDRALAQGNAVYVSPKAREAMAARPRAARYLLTEAPNEKGGLYQVVLRDPGKR